MDGSTIDYVKADIGDKMEFLFNDLLDCSSVLLATQDFRGTERIGKTMFFKTIANLLIDFRVRRFLRWEPHPFGAVPIVPAKGGIAFRQDTYLNSEHILEMKLWQYQQEGRRGYFSMKTFHKEGIAQKMFDNERLLLLETYAEIYASLTNHELNQLATCRDEARTFLCADYEENLWLDRMVKTISLLPRAFDKKGATLDYTTERVFKKSLTDSAVAAKQILVKIDMFQKSGALLDSLKDMERGGPKRLVQKIMNTVEVAELTERLLKLKRRGEAARQLTNLIRLALSASGIQEEPELARMDSVTGQYKLFSDYMTPMGNISLELGELLGIRARRIESKRLLDLFSGADLHDIVNHLKEVYLERIKRVIKTDKNKGDGFKRSPFSVVDSLSFLDFQVD